MRGRPKSEWTEAATKKLSDGKEHSYLETLSFTAEQVPPERAIRQYRKRSRPLKNSASLDDAIRMGALEVARIVLTANKTFVVNKHNSDSKVSWTVRLRTPEEEAAAKRSEEFIRETLAKAAEAKHKKWREELIALTDDQVLADNKGLATRTALLMRDHLHSKVDGQTPIINTDRGVGYLVKSGEVYSVTQVWPVHKKRAKVYRDPRDVALDGWRVWIKSEEVN